MSDTSYAIEIKPASSNGWFTPAQSNAYYKTPYARTGVTVHWWGDGTGANNHDNIVNYMNAQSAAGVKSVNYVLSDNKITMCVNPDNVAWCSNAGNPTTISVETQPTLGAEGYKKWGWLLNQLEQRYNRPLDLYRHSDWFNTDCPGTIDLSRIRAEANKWKAGAYDGLSNTSQGGDMASSNFINEVFQGFLGRPADPDALSHYGSGEYSDPEFVVNDVFNSTERKKRMAQEAQTLSDLQNQIVSLQNQVASLSTELAAAKAGQAGTAATTKQIAAEKAIDAVAAALKA